MVWERTYARKRLILIVVVIISTMLVVVIIVPFVCHQYRFFINEQEFMGFGLIKTKEYREV